MRLLPRLACAVFLAAPAVGACQDIPVVAAPPATQAAVQAEASLILTFPALKAGLAGFVPVTDAEIAASLRTILSVTHNVVEGAGAMGFAGLAKLRDRLAGKRVAIIFCGGNIDSGMLLRILSKQI